MATSKSAEPNAEPSALETFNDDAPATTPAPKRSSGLPLLLAMALLIGVGWYVWQQQPRVSIEAPTQNTPPPPSAKPVPVPAPTPQPAQEPPVETRRAIPAGNATTMPATEVRPQPKPLPSSFVSTPDVQSAGEAIKALDSATTTEERIKVIADAEHQRGSVETFFKEIGGRLNPVKIEAGPRLSELSTGDEVALYKLITAKNPNGVMLRLRPSNGRNLVDWPLFVQTHDQSFDRFVPASSEQKTKRFILIMQRSRDFELPEEDRTNFDSFLAQGSMSGAGSVRVYVSKDSPTGRLLSTRMAWGRIYLVEALLTHSEIGGKHALVVLECKDGIGDSSK